MKADGMRPHERETAAEIQRQGAEQVCEKKNEDSGRKGNGRGVNLRSDSVVRLMVRLAVPTVTAQFVNMLYNIVDRIYIGHMPGEGSSALTGVGLCFPVLTLIMAFASLVCAGGAPRAAIRMGQRDNRNAEEIMGNCFVTLLIVGAALTVLFQIFADPLLRLFGASGDTLPHGLSYLRVYLFGTVFVMISLGMNMFIMSQGFAGVSMLTTLIGAVLNIILDPVFIFALDMGVRGAAVTTVISQAVSALWVMIFLCGKKTKLRLRAENFKLSASVALPCLALGLSPFVMQSTESLLSICFNASLAKYGGDLAVGAMTIITSTAQLMAMPTIGICQGGQPIISYNFGAGDQKRVKDAFRCQFIACVSYAALFFAVTMLAPQLLAGIFTGDTQLVDYTVPFMRLYNAGIFILGVQIACQQAFMALGQAKISLLLACLRKLILLIPLIFILPHLLSDNVFAVFLAEPVSDIAAGIITGTMFFSRLPGILRRGAEKSEEAPS